ncbi:hypothetical protein [Sinorhizobium meliloti]|uniref:hypothetical protein n=1 Tax=Rhizobium meliloti TaxID=382 RepID=UPI003F15CBD6
MTKWYSDDDVLARMPAGEVADRLEAIGETDVALSLRQLAPRAAERTSSFSIFDDLLGTTIKPWMHASHIFGFLPKSPSADASQEIFHPGRIEPALHLRNGRINITLNRLRIAEYPGRGRRQVLFDFSAQNQLPTGSEDAHFSMTFRADGNALVGIINYPLFIGLNVGQHAMFSCYTVNVQNDQDETLLSALDSEVFKKGLKLAETAQPALAPLAEITVGLTKAVASRHKNVPVQNIQMGLDFGGTRLGARLAEGDYIAVQVPFHAVRTWDWGEYTLDPRVGEIVRADDGAPIPYNYFAFGISAYGGGDE